MNHNVSGIAANFVDIEILQLNELDSDRLWFSKSKIKNLTVKNYLKICGILVVIMTQKFKFKKHVVITVKI